MSSMIRVSAERMKADGNEIQEELQRTEANLKRLETAMAALAGCWEGPAWSAFQDQVAKNLAEMDEVYRFFMKYLTRLEKTGQVYQIGENEARDLMRNIRI